MDFNGAINYLQDHFATEWGATTSIVEVNEFYTSSAQTAYVGIEFMEVTSIEPQIGRTQVRIRHYGIWTVKIMTVMGASVDITLSNKVNSICECKSIGIITTRSGTKTYSGKSLKKAFWEEQYVFPFDFDEIKE